MSDPSLGLIDQVNYLQQKPDTTTGRYINGTGDFIEMLPTFEAVNTNLLTGIDDNIENVLAFELKQNYPNPFSSSTTIDFYLTESSDVELRIFNMHGVLVNTLVSDKLYSGEYSYQWNPVSNTGGIYFYSLSVDGISVVKKMIMQ